MSSDNKAGIFKDLHDRSEAQCPFCGDHGPGEPLACLYWPAAVACYHYAEFRKRLDDAPWLLKEIIDDVPSPSKEITTPDLISERQGIHGVFSDSTKFIQEAKDLMRRQPNWSKMEPYQREALDMIAHKVGRILHGDPNYVDHWRDIGGYSERVAGYLK